MEAGRTWEAGGRRLQGGRNLGALEIPMAMLGGLEDAGGKLEDLGDGRRVGLLSAPCLIPAAAAVQHPGVQYGGREGERSPSCIFSKVRHWSQYIFFLLRVGCF